MPFRRSQMEVEVIYQSGGIWAYMNTSAIIHQQLTVCYRAVAVLGWGQWGTAPPPNLAQAPQIFDWFRSALFLLEGF